MDIILACAGSGTRWNKYMGCEKQLVDINGIPLLLNTINLIKKYIPHNNLYVSVSELNKSAFEIYCKDNLFKFIELKSEDTKSNPAIYTLSKYLCNNTNMLILFGDVLYTEDAIKKISSNVNSDINFFGRLNTRYEDSKSYIKNFVELFGIYLPKTIQIPFIEISKIVKEMFDSKKITRFIHWEILAYFYTFKLEKVIPSIYNSRKIMKTFKYKKYIFSKRHFVEITDETDDFDFPEEYDAWLEIQKHKN